MTTYVAGTVTLDGQAAPNRRVLVLSYYNEPDPDNPLRERRQILGEAVSDSGAAFYIELGDYARPVIVLALDDAGTPWQPGESLAVGQRVRPTVFAGLVYQVTSAGDSGTTEPEWWSEGLGLIGTAAAEAVVYKSAGCSRPIYPAVL